MSLGSTISQTRERIGMSVEDLAALTSIRASLLREFEDDNFFKCGGETYARGHVRNIANALGVEPATFLAIYDEEHSVAARPMYDLLVENSVTAPPREKSRISLKTLSMVSGFAVVAAIGVQIAYTNVHTANKVVVAAAAQTSAPSTSSAAGAVSEPSATPAAIASTSPTPASAAAASSAPVATAAVTVEVTATRGDTWLSVTSKGGVTIFAGRLSKGDANTFTDAEGVNIRFGNAGAVDLLVNGVAVAPPGADGEVVDASYGSLPTK